MGNISDKNKVLFFEVLIFLGTLLGEAPYPLSQLLGSHFVAVKHKRIELYIKHVCSQLKCGRLFNIIYNESPIVRAICTVALRC